MKKHLVLILTFLCFGSASLAADCVSSEDMTQFATDFPQLRNLAGKQFCYDGSQVSNLISSLMFMRRTAFEADMPKSSDELFSGKFAGDWYRYFTGRIHNMDVQQQCQKGIGAFVSMYGDTMYVCPLILTDSFSSLDRASVFMHEARHIDGYPHITCSKGARKGLEGACDRRISDGGSYAVTVETYAQIAKYAKELHPALKAYALAAAATYAEETFEIPAKVAHQDRLLLMGSTKNFFLLDPANPQSLQPLGQTPELGHIVSRAEHLILFPDDRSLPARYVFTQNQGEIAQAAGDIAAGYNSQNPAERAKLLDVHISAQWTAQVFANGVRLSCDPRSDAKTDLALKDEASGILYLKGYDRVSPSAFLATQSGDLYEFGCSSKVQAFLKPLGFKLDQKFKRIQKVGDQVLGLTPDGRLFRIEGTKSTALSTAVDGQIHEIAPYKVLGFMN